MFMTAITFPICPPRPALNLLFDGRDGKTMRAKIKYIYVDSEIQSNAHRGQNGVNYPELC